MRRYHQRHRLQRYQLSLDCFDIDVRGGVAFEDDEGSFDASWETVGDEVGIWVGDVKDIIPLGSKCPFVRLFRLITTQ